MKIAYKIRLFIALLIFVVILSSFLGYFFSYNIFYIFPISNIKQISNFETIIPALVIILFLVSTFIFGRFYCSILCPVGFMQEIILLLRKRNSEYIKNNPIKYFIMAFMWGTFFGGSAFFLKYVEPSVIFSSALTYSFTGLFVIFVILLFAFYKNRLFCRLICPIGVLFGIISNKSLLKIFIDPNKCIKCGKCEKKCPVSCINVSENFVHNENCIKCLKCVDACSSGAIKYGIKHKTENIAFNADRRKFIVSCSSLLLFAVIMENTGKIIKKVNNKIKKIILPPGAESAENFVHSCYNCNLCVQNCPSKIIVKADFEHPVVHIDFNKGFCRENCIKCSQVCPTSAIKKITINEKHKIKIASAKVVSENCIHCDLCVKSCPYGAITKEYLKLPVIDEVKCIGCGACKNICSSNTIELFAIDSQITL